MLSRFSDVPLDVKANVNSLISPDNPVIVSNTAKPASTEPEKENIWDAPSNPVTVKSAAPLWPRQIEGRERKLGTAIGDGHGPVRATAES